MTSHNKFDPCSIFVETKREIQKRERERERETYISGNSGDIHNSIVELFSLSLSVSNSPLKQSTWLQLPWISEKSSSRQFRLNPDERLLFLLDLRQSQFPSTLSLSNSLPEHSVLVIPFGSRTFQVPNFVLILFHSCRRLIFPIEPRERGREGNGEYVFSREESSLHRFNEPRNRTKQE